jgi:uncharacterized membrane protein
MLIQGGAVFVVAIGATQALAMVLLALWRRNFLPLENREIWLRFATWILLALEFALAADIIRTAIDPSWGDLGKLAVIAIIRTMLNYFLARDIASLRPASAPGPT